MSALHQRIEYETAGLDIGDVVADPIEQWWRWFRQAQEADCTEPTAMTLATADADGAPDARLVLVRDVDTRGFSFFTNLTSAKSVQLAGGQAALVFGWLQLHRQVRVRGTVVPVDAAEADAYFATRPPGSQVGAWASPQSTPIADRAALEALVAAASARFGDGVIPRPPHWGGWRVVPSAIEFWQGRPSRLHDRLRYVRADDTAPWVIERLAP